MKYFEKNSKPIPFLEVWNRDDEEKWRIFVRKLWVCEGDERIKQWTVKISEGKTEKFLKLSLKRKTRNFRDWNESQDQVAKNLWDKFEKFV